MGLTVKLLKGDELWTGVQCGPLRAALHQVFTALPLGGCYSLEANTWSLFQGRNTQFWQQRKSL